VIVRGRDLKGDVALDVDAVVVGTGAGGSIALRELARAGAKVVALERGPRLLPVDFNQREDEMIPLLFEDGGGRATDDLAIRVLQGRGVGGSTLHNTNLCKRTPDAILDLWSTKYGVANVRPADMRDEFERIEADLSVSEIPASMRNANNRVLEEGCAALGWRGGPLRHNRVGCAQSGFCELGCVFDAKQNAAKIVVPDAEAHGAIVYTDVGVESVVHDGKRASGVRAIARDGERTVASLTVRAKIVVLAASAIGSAVIAHRSALPDPHAQIGRGLRIHPGGVVAGVFDRDIAGHRGIPQSYECTEHLSFEEGSDKRVWIVPAFAHPIATAAMLPGFGARHMTAMRSYRRLAVLTPMVHDETSGTVTATDDGRPILHYAMTDADRAQLAKGVAACTQVLKAAGARDVTAPARAITAVHPMGTLRMGADPRASVVDSTGEHHVVKGLFVADGSLFPTSLGGPPQISIYAMALHLAPHVLARLRAA